MTQIFAGRYTAEPTEPFAVFMIGMRINKLLAVRQWLPVARAMGPMLKTLYTHPEKGFLGGYGCMVWRGVSLVQYWRSHEDLMHFARNPSDTHLAAWRAFNQASKTDGVGIWHETYTVNPEQSESLYGNMPRWGLGAVTNHVDLGRTRRQRYPQASKPTDLPVPNEVYARG